MMMISTLSKPQDCFANPNKVIIWEISLKISSNPILPETERFPEHCAENHRSLANWSQMLTTPLCTFNVHKCAINIQGLIIVHRNFVDRGQGYFELKIKMEFLKQTEEYLRFKSENFVSSGPKTKSRILDTTQILSNILVKNTKREDRAIDSRIYGVKDSS